MGLFGSGGIIPSIGGFLGDVVTGGAVSNNAAIQETNARNVEHSREQMAFQERMSSSAYQRAMADMGKAGLNPMLAFSQGGASSPSGAMATEQASRPGDVGGNLGEQAKSLVGMKANLSKVSAETDNIKSTTETQGTIRALNTSSAEKNSASAKEIKANEQLIHEDRKLRKAQQKLTQEQINRTVADKENIEQDTIDRANDNAVRRESIQQEKNVAPAKPWINIIRDILGGANSGRSLFRQSRGPSSNGPSREQYEIDRSASERAAERRKAGD